MDREFGLILASVFRDAEDYIPRYVEQVAALARELPLHVVCVEGDSTDDTEDLLPKSLADAGIDATVLTVEHGGPKFPSIDNPWRWRQLGLVCNVALTAAVRLLTTSGEQTVTYVESDLIWDTPTMLQLDAHAHRFPAVAPLSLIGDTNQFYDSWAYIKDGQQFGRHLPYHPNVHDMMVTIDSAGSCIAMSSTAARAAEFSLQDCIRGVGRSIYAAGLSLWLDPSLAVRHPW